MIKKLSWMFILVLTVIFFNSCSDNDEPDGDSVNAAYIIGKWQGVASTGWEKEDGEISDRWNDNESFDYPYIEFRADATGVWKDESMHMHYSKTFTWYINDDYELVIGEETVGDGSGDVYRFKTLTKDKMVLISEDKDPIDGWYQEDTYKRID